MSRPLLYRLQPAICAALLALASTPAFAQGTDSTTPTTPTVTGITVRPLSVGDKEVQLDGTVQVGIDDCKNDVVVKFRLDNFPSSKESVDVYTGTSCNTVASRQETTNASCDYIGNYDATQNQDLEIEIKVDLLIKDCNSNENSEKTLWFLAVDDPKSAEDVGSNYGQVPMVRLDTRRPDAPTSIKGGTGESQIPVSWKATGSDLDGFVVLIDPSPTTGGVSSGSAGNGSSGGDSGTASGSDMSDEDGGTTPTGGGSSAGGDCGSADLTPGGLTDGLPSRIIRKNVGEPTATGIDLKPGDFGLEDGQSAAIAVIAVDLAGNESPISEIACVKVVPTTSFWDQYQQDPDAVDKGCPCAAVGPAQLESAWPIALVLGLTALSARRRRRS